MMTHIFREQFGSNLIILGPYIKKNKGLSTLIIEMFFLQIKKITKDIYDMTHNIDDHVRFTRVG